MVAWKAVFIWVSREVEHNVDSLPGGSPPLWNKISLALRPRFTAEPSRDTWLSNMGTDTDFRRPDF